LKSKFQNNIISTPKKSAAQEKRKKANWAILGLTFLIYLIILTIKPGIIINSLKYFIHIFLKVFYIIIIVFVFIFITNLFLKPKIIVKHLGAESGLKGWFIAIVSGIISMGSIYLWYPLLKELKDRGMKKGLIAAFLYNRAVKIPLLPLMVYYFGWKFTVFLTVYMIIFSIFMGITMDKIT